MYDSLFTVLPWAIVKNARKNVLKINKFSLGEIWKRDKAMIGIRQIWLLPLILLLIFTVGCEKRVVDEEQVGANEKIVIKFSHVTDDNSPKGLAALRFARLVEERTDNFVEVQVFPNGKLYRDGEEIEALQENNVQMIAPATSKLADMAPQFQIFDLPYSFESIKDVDKMARGETGQKLISLLEPYDIKGLAFWHNGFKQMTSSIRPLVQPEDFVGLRFRTMSGKVVEKQFRQLNAFPVTLPFNDVYVALEKGKIDGQENTLSNIANEKFYRVQKYMTLSNHGYLGYMVLTNKTFWDGLPKDIREILTETLLEVTEWEVKVAEEKNREALDEIIKQGKMNIHFQTTEEKLRWQKAMQGIDY